MADTFEAQIDKFVADTEAKMLAVLKNSIQQVAKEASKPVKRGGKMPVDTGFLRKSGAGALNEIPTGETKGRKRQEGEMGVLPEYKFDESNFLHDILARMEIGDVFYFGWTAEYAEKQELYNGFLKSAVDRWNEIVNAQVRRLKK